MSEEVLRRIIERGDRDAQRRADQERSIKPTEYIGNGYVKQLGQSPTRSRYLSNAGLVIGELVAPLGHGQQDVIIHKKPEPFTVAKQPQETIGIISAYTIQIYITRFEALPVSAFPFVSLFVPPGGISAILNFPVAGTVTFEFKVGTAGGIITLGQFSYTAPPFNLGPPPFNIPSLPPVSTIVAPGNSTFTATPGEISNSMTFSVYYESETFSDSWTNKPISWYQSSSLVWEYNPTITDLTITDIIYVSEE
jgi:hypothetical protein